jgi:hypothetical protein
VCLALHDWLLELVTAVSRPTCVSNVIKRTGKNCIMRAEVLSVK